MVAVFIVLVLFVTAIVGTVRGDTTAAVTIPDEANIRSGAGTTFSVIRVGHKGEKFESVGSFKDTSGRTWYKICLLYTSDAADDLLCVDLGGRRIITKKTKHHNQHILRII